MHKGSGKSLKTETSIQRVGTEPLGVEFWKLGKIRSKGTPFFKKIVTSEL